jgi:ribosomal protein S18 acetylase RimI-like enzyme
MMGQCSFQQATKHDKAAIFDLYCQVMKEYIAEIWGWDQEWQENDFTKHFSPGNITVVREENKVIGYSQIEDQGNQLYIRMLLLLPNQQRKGIGSRLLNAVIEKANAQSKGIALQVFKVNERARRFYEYHGFQVQGETPSSFTMVFMPNKAN